MPKARSRWRSWRRDGRESGEEPLVGAAATERYVCQECGAVSGKWVGRCESCGAWNTLTTEAVRASAPRGLSRGKGRALLVEPLAGESPEPPRLLSGIGELDRVVGGGFVPGSTLLIGGDPGIGKSTVLLQAMAGLARRGHSGVYVTGEEALTQIRGRARRLGIVDAPLDLAAASSVRDIVTTIERTPPPEAFVIDSIQTMYVDSIDSAPGSVTQVRASAQALIQVAKQRGSIAMLIGHLTKEGLIAGPRVLEHMVDTVLYFEGERGHQFRILRAVKNRYGAADEIGIFEMTGAGLQEVTNPSALFLAGRRARVCGNAIFAGIEGTRPLLVEIQALVAPSPFSAPRRAVVGWDAGRLAMLLAVLEARCGVQLATSDVYLNVAGGLRITEPAADLAVAAALLSAQSGAAAPEDSVFFGEVGLSGEVRPIGHLDQ
ncbi:MAG: DNA repair protein RadA, partial [Alphaproteobacteria bacterium]|nr:DNA repair protein RadA [Alphaproteobacteria bacterium]